MQVLPTYATLPSLGAEGSPVTQTLPWTLSFCAPSLYSDRHSIKEKSTDTMEKKKAQTSDQLTTAHI